MELRGREQTSFGGSVNVAFVQNMFERHRNCGDERKLRPVEVVERHRN